nr:MAG TPA: DNA TRANSLOCASE FTSK, KOPS, XERCD, RECOMBINATION, DNA [Caudoviricetes sp.]
MFRNTSVRNIREKFGVGQVRARKIINAVKTTIHISSTTNILTHL